MTYSLTSPVPSVQNVGVAQQSVFSLGAKPVCNDGTVTHCFAGFGADPTYVHYVNSTGAASSQFWVGGYEGSSQSSVRSAAYNPYNNKMYLGGAFLFEIDLNETPPTFADLNDSLSGCSGIGVGNSGLVWHLDHVTRLLKVYNPDLGTWKSYGTPYADGGDYQYTVVGMDSTYIFFACVYTTGSMQNSLFYCPIAGTPNWQAWPYNGQGDQEVFPFCAWGTTDWYIYRKLADNSEKTYTFSEGTFTETAEFQGTARPFDNAPWYCQRDAGDVNLEGEYFYGWNFDFSALLPVKEVWEYSMITVTDGETPFQSSEPFAATDFVDNPLNSVIGVGGSTFLSLGVGNAAAATFDPSASEGNRITYLGAEVLSPYIVKRHPASGEIYAGGYPNKVWRFDPTYPLVHDDWTFNPSYQQSFDPADDPKPNPYFIDLGAKMLHYRLCIDFDAAGLVWIGGNTVRLSPNWGDVMWYNPTTGASAYMFPSWEDDKQVRDVCAANNRSIICVSNDHGEIWFIDTATKAVDPTPLVPVDAGSCWLIEASLNVVLGIYMLTTTYKVFTFNPTTKALIVSPQDLGVSGVPFGWGDNENNRRYFKLELGPDGYVWMFVDATLYRINPATCGFESVVTLDDPGKLKFASNNTDLLIHYSTANDNFYIPRILTFHSVEYSKGAYTSLPADDADLLEIYTSEQREDVRDDDGTRVGESGNGYILHQFKEVAGPYDSKVDLHCNLQAPLAPADYSVYLQCYDRVTVGGMWVTVVTNNAAAANTDFDMDFQLNSGTTPTFANCKDEDGVISSRVYQTNVPLS